MKPLPGVGRWESVWCREMAGDGNVGGSERGEVRREERCERKGVEESWGGIWRGCVFCLRMCAETKAIKIP